MVYAALLALAALDAAGYGMLAPVIPEITERTGTGPGVAGALVACFAVGQLVGYPIAGRLAQQRAARPTLLLSLVFLLAGDLAFVLGDGLEAWFPGESCRDSAPPASGSASRSASWSAGRKPPTAV